MPWIDDVRIVEGRDLWLERLGSAITIAAALTIADQWLARTVIGSDLRATLRVYSGGQMR